jgi:LuxR family transcriptional regulator, maltose regulon positive regulatory protein
LAQYPRGRTERSIHQAVELLDRLLRAADEGQRAGSALEILVLQAVADQMRDNVSAALWPLERALTLAEPEGYVRIFVDQGPPMAALLEAAAERGIAASYVRRLLGAFDKGEPCTPVRQDFGRPIERT